MRSFLNRRFDRLRGSFLARLTLPVVGVMVLLVSFAGQQATRSATDHIVQQSEAAHEIRIAMLEQQLAAEEFVLSGDVSWLLEYQQEGRELEARTKALRSFGDTPADDRTVQAAFSALRVVQRTQERAIAAATTRRNASPEDIWDENGEGIAGEAELVFDALAEHIDGKRSDVESRAMLISLTALGILVAIGLSIAMLLDARLRQGRLRQRAESKLSDALQVTRTEKEAERLVALHVQDVIPGGRATLLRSNNSENRLAAVTDPGNLAGPLAEAIPSDCLAIRRARTNVNDPSQAELLRCGICGAHRSTCVPTMVGGHVTGSLVVVHERKPRKNAVDLTEAAVERAAPVIASHRALSVAERRAATDGLTGIANARAGHETVIQMVAQAQRSGQTLSAIVADLDHFKQVNDHHGHATGDRTLAAVAATIKASIRKSDFVARMGGEEFLLLLPDTERPGAVDLAEKVRSRIAEQAVTGVPAITISLGVACLPDDASDAEALLRSADHALYEAKRTGRDRVCVPVDSLGQPGT